MDNVINKYETDAKKVGYSATAHPEILKDMRDKAHDLRIPLTKLIEGLMKNYLITGEGYEDKR